MEQEMKLTIFAATGGIGRQLLEQAVAAGDDVTAVVRNPKNLSAKVRVVTADLAAADPAALESAVAGADAVISALGPRSSAEAGVAWQGTRAIVQAMKATNVRSEEHTSELQSHSDLVCRLLLEKKKNRRNIA